MLPRFVYQKKANGLDTTPQGRQAAGFRRNRHVSATLATLCPVVRTATNMAT